MQPVITNDQWNSMARYEVSTKTHIDDVFAAIKDIGYGSCALHLIVLKRAEYHLGDLQAYQATSDTNKLRKLVAVLSELLTERLG